MNDLLHRIKSDLRISDDNIDFDDEITDLIEQAIADLRASGIKSEALADIKDIIIGIDGVDGNIRRAIILYCKAFFGLENPDKDWYLQHYFNKKAELLNQRTQYNARDSNV